MAGILLADDDERFRKVLADAMTRRGHRVHPSATLAEARRVLDAGGVELACLGARLADGSGIEALTEIRAMRNPPEVIILARRGDPDGAEQALRRGAWDYLVKPDDVERLVRPLLRALAARREKPARPASALSRIAGVVGSSPRLAACLEQAGLAASNGADVLLTGETGTGKELFARAIHASGARAAGPFVVVDCAALPAPLVESLLFGHERGAFTGADRRKTGLIAQADGGTLFLDEVGELPLAVQAKFLRVLQERAYRPVGGTHLLRSDFRLCAATNRDLAAMAGRGAFRRDLLFRLGAFRIDLPPLRERNGDVRELLRWRLALRARRAGRTALRPSPEYLELLERHDWPGNVRELLQVVDVSCLAAHGENTLLPQHLPIDLRVRLLRGRMADPPQLPAPSAAPFPPAANALRAPWREFRARVLLRAEAEYFSALMARCCGDVALAARIAGLKTARFYELLGKHGLVPGRRTERRLPKIPE